MNRAQFIARLKDCLKKLPADERSNIIRYYEEYFDDAGAENEQAVIAELGSPQKVAWQVKADCAVRNMDKETKKGSGLRTFWIVLLAIFASPIALPLAVGAFALVLGLSITLLAIVFAICMTAFAIFVSGIVGVGVGIAAMFQAPPIGAFLLGSGLIICSLGVLIVWGAIALCRVCFRGMTRTVSKRSKRSPAAAAAEAAKPAPTANTQTQQFDSEESSNEKGQ